MEKVYYNSITKSVMPMGDKLPEKGYETAWVYSADELAEMGGVVKFTYGLAYLRAKNGKLLKLAPTVCGLAGESVSKNAEWYGKLTVVENDRKYQMIDLGSGKILAEDELEITPLNKEYYTTHYTDWSTWDTTDYSESYTALKKNGVELSRSSKNITPKYEDGKLVSVTLGRDTKVSVEDLDKRYQEKQQLQKVDEAVKSLKELGLTDKDIADKLKSVIGTSKGINI